MTHQIEGGKLPSEALERLGVLLKSADKKSEQWQGEVARLVGIVHSRSQQSDLSDLESLELMAWVARAEHVGSKEAKKRKLNFARFRNGLGEDFLLPEPAELQEAYLLVLHELRAEWCLNFVQQSIPLVLGSSLALRLSFSWADKNSKLSSEFVDAVFAPILLPSVSDALKLGALKELQKFIKVKKFSCSGDASEFLLSVAQVASRQFLQNSSSVSLIGAVLGVFECTLDRVIRMQPGCVLDPKFHTAVVSLAASCPAHSKKRVEKLRNSLGELVVATVESLGERFGGQILEQLTILLPVFERTYPKVRAGLSSHAKRIPVLTNLLGVASSSQGQSDESLGHEKLRALLVRWIEVRENVRATDFDLTPLGDDILRATEAYGVSFLGTACQVVDFDPIEHRLLDESSGATLRVRVIRPGVILERTDGTVRVLHPAIVEPAGG